MIFKKSNLGVGEYVNNMSEDVEKLTADVNYLKQRNIDLTQEFLLLDSQLYQLSQVVKEAIIIFAIVDILIIGFGVWFINGII